MVEVKVGNGSEGTVNDSDDPTSNPGELTFEEDVAGGMGRHLGIFSCTMLNVGHIIGTGIFSTPSSILSSVDSVGASLILWLLGFVLSFFGLFVWLELGTMIPRSGGEKVYMEAVYKKPKLLATVIFAMNAILLGSSAANAIVFASNILVSVNRTTDRWVERGIAIGVMIFVTILHGFTPKIGIALMNALSVFKVAILLLIVITGWIVLAGKTRVRNPTANFHHAFVGSTHSSNDYATAMFKVLFTYSGWSNLNYVLNDVRNPVRTLKISGPLGLGICAVLYLFANVAYFAAATKEEMTSSGVAVAALFFGNVFGTKAERALAVIVALSALGHVVTAAYTASRVNQELAKEGIPFPFGNKFWASNWPTRKTPLPGLIVHLVTSVIIIIGPPPSVAYPFILDIEGYPQQIINLFVVLGLFWLRWKKPNAHRPFKIWLPFSIFFLAATVFLIIAPFLRPPNGIGDTPPLPYYLYSLVGIAIIAFGIIYWATWRVVLPKIFGYKLVSTKVVLSDGTVVNTFLHKKVA